MEESHSAEYRAADDLNPRPQSFSRAWMVLTACCIGFVLLVGATSSSSSKPEVGHTSTKFTGAVAPSRRQGVHTGGITIAPPPATGRDLHKVGKRTLVKSSEFTKSSRGSNEPITKEKEIRVAPEADAIVSTPKNPRLVLLLHGQSVWNHERRYSGWSDVPLTEEGQVEARNAGQLLRKNHFQFDKVHTSLLSRAVTTTNMVMQQLDQEWVPVRRDWRLNERSYGVLSGMHEEDAAAKFGMEKVYQWRKSWDMSFPTHTREESPFLEDRRYKSLDMGDHPLGESLKDTYTRSKQFWDEVVVPDIKQGHNVLLVVHEDVLRSILMCFDDFTTDQITLLDIPHGVPLVYEMDSETQTPIRKPGSMRRKGQVTGKYLFGDTTTWDKLSDILKTKSFHLDM